MTKTVTQHYTTVTALKAAITDARVAAKLDAQRNCPRGALYSRGAWVRVVDARGDVIMGEADSWAFVGTAAQMTELGNLLRYDTRVAGIEIVGGWDWALNPRDYADGAYDAWVSEWCVDFGGVEVEAASAFTAMRGTHQNVTGGAISGEVPTAMYLHAKPDDEQGGYGEQRFGWLGCLDATDLMPAGSTRALFIPEEHGGWGYEGNVSRIVEREYRTKV